MYLIEIYDLDVMDLVIGCCGCWFDYYDFVVFCFIGMLFFGFFFS